MSRSKILKIAVSSAVALRESVDTISGIAKAIWVAVAILLLVRVLGAPGIALVALPAIVRFITAYDTCASAFEKGEELPPKTENE